MHREPKAESDRQSRLTGVRSRGILASLGHNMCRVTRKVLTRHEVTRLLTRRVEKHAMSRRLNEYRSERIGARACADRGQRSVGLVVKSRTCTPLDSGKRVPRHLGQYRPERIGACVCSDRGRRSVELIENPGLAHHSIVESVCLVTQDFAEAHTWDTRVRCKLERRIRCEEPARCTIWLKQYR